MADAQITVGANADAATRAAAVVKAAWRDAGQSITSSIGSAARQVVGDLANVVTAQGKISFSSQHQQVREFEAATAHLAVSAGRDLESVRSEAEATGKAIVRRPAEVANWSAEVGKLTGNFTAAGQAIKGLSGLAAETGRSVDDYRGLAVELQNVGHVAGDTTHVVGVLAAQADALGTTGGVAAFTDQVQGLSDTISHFAIKGEADFLKVTAAAAVLGKGLSQAAAQRVQQGALGAIAADPLRWERFLGHSITDEHGQVRDPVKALQEITEKVKHRYGHNARRVLELNFGVETGAAMFNADFSEAARAAGLAPSSKPAEAQKALNNTDAGKRDVAAAELAASSRALLGSSTMLGKAADAMQRFAAHSPITSTFVATALGTGMNTFLQKFGGSLSTLMGGKGAGGGVGGAVQIATKGTKLGRFAGAAGSVLAAGAIGYEIGSAADEAFGISDFISGTGSHSRVKSEDAKLDAGRDAALRQRLARDKRVDAAVNATMGLSFEEEQKGRQAAHNALAAAANPNLMRGGDESIGALIAELRKRGESDAEAQKIAKAVADALKNVKIVNGTGGPIEVTAASSSSASAGSQAH